MPDLTQPVVKGPAVVDEDPRLARRVAAHDGSVQARRHIRRVMQHPVARDAVERAVVEREVLGVADGDLGGHAQRLDVRLCGQLDVTRRQVDAGGARAGAGVLRQVDPLTAADVEHVESRRCES